MQTAIVLAIEVPWVVGSRFQRRRLEDHSLTNWKPVMTLESKVPGSNARRSDTGAHWLFGLQVAVRRWSSRASV